MNHSIALALFAIAMGLLLFLISILCAAFVAPRLCCRCKIHPATLEIGDSWVCRQCWEWLETQRHILDAISSSEADDAIRDYERRHPNG